MFWITLFLAIPALALAAAVWGVLRRKWYGVLPLLVVAMVGWMWQESWWIADGGFLGACANHSAVAEVMILFLADGAAVMSLAALWSGWSRGWWFWRAVVFAAVPASLVPLEANELILLCLLTMPVLTTTAWLLRNCRDRFGSPRREDETHKRRKQFSLANLFLAFIVLGMFATALRSVLVGHIILADWGLIWLAGSIAFGALAAALPVLARGSGRKWLISWSAIFAVGMASWWWLTWSGDALGLVTYFDYSMPVVLIEGELCFFALVGLLCSTYALVELPLLQQTRGRIASATLLVFVLGIIAPLAMIYPRLLPPSMTVTPLPPHQAQETIQRATIRIVDLERQGAARNRFLSVLNELDQELVEPGHVTHDVAALARERIFPSNADDPKLILGYAMRLEITRAIHEKRDADAVRLARLQWRIGRTFYLGGTIQDFRYGFAVSPSFVNEAIIAEAPRMLDQECRDVLSEALNLERSEPDFATLRQFDDYWLSASTGWRNRLHDTAAWLTGARNYRFERISQAEFEKWRKRPLASLRTVQYVLALELYRREHGRYPDDLPTVRAAFDLPEILDPFTPFAPVYRRTDAGFLLYSVGFDGKDDGGNFPPRNTSVAADSVGQDINLVVNRDDVSESWRAYVKAMTPAPPPTMNPAATK